MFASRPRTCLSAILLGGTILPSLGLPGAALAGETDGADTAFTVTVTAPAQVEGVPQQRVSSAQSDVTAQEIEDQQIRRLEDALELVPGVTLTGKRGLGQPQHISLRGLGARNVRVFIDGVEVSDPSQAQSTFALGDLNMADVARIQVLRGPHPGRYGPDTGGGVIVIETKRPAARFSGEVGAEYGSYDTKRGHAAVSGIEGPVEYRLSASGTHALGYSDFNENRGGDAEDPFRAYSVAGRLGVQASDALRFDATARYMRENLFYDGSSGDTDWDRDESERFLRLSGTLHALDDRLVQTLGVSDALTTRQFWGTGTAGDTYDGTKTRLDYVAAFAAAAWLNLEVGADATREGIAQSTPGFAPTAPDMDRHFWRRGGFITAGMTPLAGLDLAGTLRADDHDEFGGKTTWRLGAAYTVAATDTTVRGSYGTAWQTPSLYERHDPCYGRADLKPEDSKGWDLGIDQGLFGGAMVASVTYFRTRTDNEIDWHWSPPSKPGCLGGGYVNINETRVEGVETEIAARPFKDVELRAAYTWQNAVDHRTDTRLGDRPLHQASASLGWWFLPGAYVNLGLRYRDNTEDFGGESDEFWTADLRLSYAVSEAVTLHGRIENLFDAEYEEKFGHGTPDRSAYAGATVKF